MCLINFRHGFLQMLFGSSYGSVIINWISQLWSDIGIGNCYCILSQYICLFQHINPLCPVFAAHHLHGTENFFFCCRSYSFLCNLIVSQIQAFLCKGFSCGLQTGGPCSAFCIGTSRRSQTVNDQIHFSQIFSDYFDCLLFNFSGKSIPIDRFGISTFLCCQAMKFCRIIPTRCSRSSAVCLTFKHNSQSICPAVLQRTDTGCQTISCGTSDDQCFLCSVYCSLPTGILCLITHTFCTPQRMCGCADIFSYFWFDDHDSLFSLILKLYYIYYMYEL